ncbi:hypothetical protein ALC57_01303, partial [Trachymyrmex cornetzi]
RRINGARLSMISWRQDCPSVPIHVRFQLAVVWVIRKLARTADRRVITRQSSTGIQFLDDYRIAKIHTYTRATYIMSPLRSCIPNTFREDDFPLGV